MRNDCFCVFHLRPKVGAFKRYFFVKRLLPSQEEYDHWKVNKRPPKVGDTGALIDKLEAPDAPIRYVVENCDADGATIWMCEFVEEEIEIGTDVP